MVFSDEIKYLEIFITAEWQDKKIPGQTCCLFLKTIPWEWRRIDKNQHNRVWQTKRPKHRKALTSNIARRTRRGQKGNQISYLPLKKCHKTYSSIFFEQLTYLHFINWNKKFMETIIRIKEIITSIITAPLMQIKIKFCSIYIWVNSVFL